MIRALWRHVTYNYREGGTGQVLSKIASRLRHWTWSDEVWRVYRRDTGGVPLETRLPLTDFLLALRASPTRSITYWGMAVFTSPANSMKRVL